MNNRNKQHINCTHKLSHKLANHMANTIVVFVITDVKLSGEYDEVFEMLFYEHCV